MHLFPVASDVTSTIDHGDQTQQSCLLISFFQV